jgi:hypothetical protein
MYCRVIVFKSVRLDDPANDNSGLTSAPIVNSPGYPRATTGVMIREIRFHLWVSCVGMTD